jgi:hypothetical protein
MIDERDPASAIFQSGQATIERFYTEQNVARRIPTA